MTMQWAGARAGFVLWAILGAMLEAAALPAVASLPSSTLPLLPVPQSPAVEPLFTPQNSTLFTEGVDYFAYREPLPLPQRADGKIPIWFFFDYDCRVCSQAADILQFYSQLKQTKVTFEEYPVATADNDFSAKVFYLLEALNATDLSQGLLFETAEKSRYTALADWAKIRHWLTQQGIDANAAEQVWRSPELKRAVRNAVRLTEDYGVFTYPYAIIGGKYVLTASTLYNDDYSMAVLDFLTNKIERDNK